MNESELIISLASVIAFFSVPVVWILTAHQRKMAEIIHGMRGKEAASNNEAMAIEMQQLRQALHQQTIALDSLATELRKGNQGAGDPLSGRLSEAPAPPQHPPLRPNA